MLGGKYGGFHLFSFFFFFFVVAASSAEIDINLSTLNWTLSNERGYNNVTIAGSLPGDSFTDLLAAGLIEDPYYRFNDVNYRWISLDNWTYSATIPLSESMLAQSRILLWFEGLDTVSSILVNGTVVGTTNNMFRRYHFDIKDHIGTNAAELVTLQIEFVSSYFYAKSKAEETNYNIPQSNYKTELPHRNFIRTAQCHFAWDWGPCFLTQGSWQSASLKAFSDGIIQYVAPQITPFDINDLAHWKVDVEVWMLPAHKEIEGEIHVELLGVAASKPVSLSTEPVQVKLELNIVNLPAQSLWWPRGYGEQPLFPLTASFVDLSQRSIREINSTIGFRSIEIIQEPLPHQVGLTFYFQVNNVPIFAKGANWIPADAFESRVTNQVLEDLLQSAYDANMNTIRNWGGGIYQHDRFYEICDELGILVWEEFMFACSMYPRDHAFLETVKEEVQHQVLRLMAHPSLIIWSGNNENELALGGWYEATRANPFRYVVDYSYLNTDTLYDTIHGLDHSRPWLPSSPSNGVLDVDPYVERWGDPGSSHWGDVHFYNYDSSCTDVSIYPEPRFASEFGFQSFPSLSTLSQVSLPEDWTSTSNFIEHRQHHPQGNEELDASIMQHFIYPNSTDSVKQFSDWLYLTQCLQSLCLRTESEHYRRLKGEKAYTMGTLYWQLNSIWQGPTWSSLEYGNTWKMAHYSAKEFFAETIISSFVSTHGEYNVYITSDSMVGQSGTFEISAVLWRTGIQAFSWSGTSSIAPLASVNVFQKNIDVMLAESKCERNEVYFHLEWTDVSFPTAENQYFLTPIYEAPLVPVLFDLQVVGSAEGEILLSLSCTAVAPFTFLENASRPGRFSQNGFLCSPAHTFFLTFFGSSGNSQTFVKETLVRSIQETYMA